MLRNRIQRIGLLATGGLVLTFSASLVGAIELRTTSGNKTIIRRAMLQAESAPTVEAETLPAPRPAPDEPTALSMEFVPEAMECGEASVAGCCLPSAAGRLWVDVEFLMWWRKGRNFPPLVTTQPNDGVLPQAATLFGGQRVDESPRPGGRLELGLWLGPCQRFGVGGHFLALSDAPVQFSITESDFALFGRPFILASDGSQKTQLIASDEANPPTAGRLDLSSKSDVLVSDAFFRWGVWRSCRYRVDLLAGYQYARIEEDLTIDAFTQQTGTSPYPTLAITDQFSTKNEFHGGHFGLLGQCDVGRAGVELFAKFAFGNMHETASISGHRTSTVAAAPTPAFQAGRGLLTQPTNSGEHVQDAFSYMHDVGLKLTYCPVERLQLSLGYSLLYWSSVLRPGYTIDKVVDGNLITNNDPTGNEVHPVYRFNPKDFYVHGLNVGLEYRF